MTVAARNACIGDMPRSTSATSSLAFWPCGIAGASVPHAIFTPAAMALGNIAWACGKISAAFFCSSGAARSMAIASVR